MHNILETIKVNDKGQKTTNCIKFQKIKLTFCERFATIKRLNED